MPKTVTVLAGLIVVSAVAYKVNENKNRQQQLQQYSINSGLEKEVDTLQASLKISQLYIKQRLIPSVKASWNDHVTKATHSMIDADVPSKASHLWNKHILGHSNNK